MGGIPCRNGKCVQGQAKIPKVWLKSYDFLDLNNYFNCYLIFPILNLSQALIKLNMIIATLILHIASQASACLLTQYYNTTLNTCISCETGCDSCISPSCQICSTGYYQQEQICYKCPSECQTCLNLIDCSTCSPGFYLNPKTQSCNLCSSNCITCVQNQCTRCNQGYYLSSSSECSPCYFTCECSDGFTEVCPQNPYNSSTLLAIAIGLPLALICIVVSLIVCYKKCCKVKRNNQTENNSIQQSQIKFNFDLKAGGGVLHTLAQNSWKREAGGQCIAHTENCAICLQDNVNLRTRCNHLYHSHCLAMWLVEHKNCPICKSQQISPLKKFCIICHKSYILCKIHNLSKYQVFFFQRCRECRIEILQSQADIKPRV